MRWRVGEFPAFVSISTEARMVAPSPQRLAYTIATILTFNSIALRKALSLEHVVVVPNLKFIDFLYKLLHFHDAYSQLLMGSNEALCRVDVLLDKRTAPD